MGRPLPRRVGLVPVVARFGGERVGLTIAYTGLHGTGALAVPAALKAFGFRNVHEVPSQAIPDGAFPTVHSPNPEEGAALAEAVALAKQVGAAIVMGTDPDSDRVGIAVPDGDGFRLLNGNETAALLVDHVLAKWQAAGKLDRPSFVAKTVVTTDLLAELAKEYGVEVRETLTGFKFIAEAIRQEEGNCSTWLEEKRATATSSGTPCATRMRFRAAACWRSLPTSWTGRARPCWAVWPPSTSATRPTKKGW